MSPEQCAREIYHGAPWQYEPGTTFNYNSFHLQVAGAMAQKQSGVSMQELLQRNLFDKAGMQRSSFLGHTNPMLAAAMLTTPSDYDAFLRKYLAYELLPQEVAVLGIILDIILNIDIVLDI